MPLRHVKASDWGKPIESVSVQKASAVTGSIVSIPGAGNVVWPHRNYQVFAKEGYTENAEANACIQLYAAALKGINYKVYQKQKGGKRKALDAHPLLDLLHHPNEEQGDLSGFVEGWVIYLLCAGNVYVERVGPRPGAPPRELHLQRPDRMQVIAGNAQQLIRGYQYQAWFRTNVNPWYPDDIRTPDGKRCLVQRILHSKFFHPVDDWYGLSPMQVAGRPVDEINAAQSWNYALLANGARPSGLLTIDGIDSEQREEVEDQFNNKHSGTVNVGKTLVVQGAGVNYARFTNTAQEMDWLEGQELATRRICSVFKVPIEMIGDSKNRTYSNFQEARLSFYMEGVIPLANFMLSQWNQWLQPFFGSDIEIGYDPEEIEALQENKQYVAERALNGLKAGALTPDDYRQAIGLSPLPNGMGQYLYIPTTSTPVSVNPKADTQHPIVNIPARNVPVLPSAEPEPEREPPPSNPRNVSVMPRRNN